jgi:hypothetical protein
LTHVAILKKKAAIERVRLSDDVAYLIASRVIVGEALGRDVGHRHRREEPGALVADGVREMRLAETHAAIDEQ